MQKRLFLTVLLLTVLSFNARGQEASPPISTEPAKIELGVHLSSINLGPQVSPFFDFTDRSHSELGVGVRFGYNINRYVAVEAEGDFFPHRYFPQLNSGGSLAQAQFGLKAGKRFEKFGLFAKARPGFVTFGEILTQTGSVTFPFQGNGPLTTFPIFEEKRRNFFSLDAGAVVELYASRGLLVRFDLGDTMIHYGDAPVSPFSDSPGIDRVSHKFQFSAGIVFRYLNPETTDENNFQADDQNRKFEIGAQFTSLNLREISEGFTNNRRIETLVFGHNNQLGVGIRIGYNFTPHISAEVQSDYYPGDIGLPFSMPAGGRTFQIQAGPKFGKRFENFGFFVKARPGIVTFSNTMIFDPSSPPFFILQFHNGRATHFSMDAGGVLEFYVSRRLFARFDCGDTMIRYGPRLLGFFPAPMKSLTTVTHNLQVSAGVGFRF
jgi:hypothetical protein